MNYKCFPIITLFCLLTMNAHADNETSDVPATPTKLDEVVVTGKLDQARDSIVPSLGATQYTVDSKQIDNQSRGDNAPFNQVILRMPGVSEDSYGQLHIRGEHGNPQYRINDVLLPEGISGFGQELDTRFVDHVSLINGTLPAQFSNAIAGIVDIHTKSGALNSGWGVTMYGGSYDTVQPNITFGGSHSNVNYYFTGSYLQNNIGIESPTSSATPIHDLSKQPKAFSYISLLLDDTSRISIMLSGSYGHFEIPNIPNQPQNFTLNGVPFFNSANLNERQTEQNYYGIVAYQKATDTLNLQLSAFSRYSSIAYNPDNNGDLIFNGVASLVNNKILSNGLELDSSYILGEHHTLRSGFLATISKAMNDNNSLVFPANAQGQQTPGSNPLSIVDNNHKWGEVYGIYLQDEWKISEPLTINFGCRFDQALLYVSELQFSPRVNVVYNINQETTAHAGYARYFTPPEFQLMQNTHVSLYNNTTNFFEVKDNPPARAEVANYFDAGLTHSFSPALKVGIDGYLKLTNNQLDQGQFGQAIIFVPFNYAQGRIYGVEFSADYNKNGFSGYNNVAWVVAKAKQMTSGQFQFPQDELDYIATHWIRLDHAETFTGSTGVAYTLLKKTKFYSDIIWGSGLREGFANTATVGFHYPVNVGIAHTFKTLNFGTLKAHFDIVNIADQIYEIRNGSGIGVFAAQYGQRRGFFGGLSVF